MFLIFRLFLKVSYIYLELSKSIDTEKQVFCRITLPSCTNYECFNEVAITHFCFNFNLNSQREGSLIQFMKLQQLESWSQEASSVLVARENSHFNILPMRSEKPCRKENYVLEIQKVDNYLSRIIESFCIASNRFISNLNFQRF